MQRRSLLAFFGGSVAIGHPAARAQTAAAPIGELKALGDERYQIGRIVLDKRARSFSVPGRIHALDKPLEYLATTPTGRRAYESLLELDTTGTELNLACILVGLERDPDLAPTAPPTLSNRVGPRVALWLSWNEGGKRRKVPAAEALLSNEARAKGVALDWAYTGSYMSPEGNHLAADETGTLISFVKKDPTGIFEAVSERGLGPYGAVRGNAMLPPEGSAIELVVDAANAAK